MLLLRELAILALLGAAEAGFYSAKSNPVIEVDNKTFKKEILESDHAAIVEFYAPWCGHCKNLKPAYEKVGNSMKGLAKVAGIDCDDDKNKRICGDYDVKGFPTLKLFRPTGKKGKPAVEDYNGPRTAKAIADALAERIPNHVTKVTANKLGDFLSKSNATAKAILFTNKGTTPALWKSLAIDFKGKIAFATIRDKEAAAVETFGVTEFPKIVLLPGGEKEGVVYDGKVAKEPLAEFFKGADVSGAEAPVPEPEESPEEKTEMKEEVKSEEPVTEKPPKKTIAGLKTKADLIAECFAPKKKSCLLGLLNLPNSDSKIVVAEEEVTRQFDALTKVIDKLERRGEPYVFQAFVVDADDTLGKELAKDLELPEERPAFAILSRRGWYRKYSGSVENTQETLAWLDAVTMGEGAKGKIPASLMGDDEEEAEAAPVEAAPEPEPEAEVKTEEAPEAAAETSGHDEL